MKKPLIFLVAYLAVAALITMFAANIVPDDTARLIVFAAFVFMLSILLPYICGPLDKDNVDFLYYGTALIAAVMVFYVTSARRQRAQIEESISYLNHVNEAITIELEILSSKINAYHYVMANVDTILRLVKGELITEQSSSMTIFQERFKIVEDNKAKRDITCSRYKAILDRIHDIERKNQSVNNSADNPASKFLQKNPALKFLQDAALQFLYLTPSLKFLYLNAVQSKFYCDNAEAEVAAGEDMLDRDAKEININSLWLPNDSSVWSVIEQLKQVGGTHVTVYDIRIWLNDLKTNNNKTLLALTDAQKIGIQQLRDNGSIIKDKKEKLLRVEDDNKTDIGILIAKIREVYWPYIAISLVCLKLSRVNYIEKIIKWWSVFR